MFKSVPITLPPGVARDKSRFAIKGRYYDASMVRFPAGQPERWGGWQQMITATLGQPARAAISWRANDSTPYVAFATADKLWLLYSYTLYDLTPDGFEPGVVDSATSGAWGEGGWGEGAWGGVEDPAGSPVLHASTWTLAKWGEDLLAVRRGGPLLHWVKADGEETKAVVVAEAPAVCGGVFVTEDRHAVIFGADGDPLLLKWPNRETLDEWEPDATNTAGDLRLEDGSEILAATPIAGGHLLKTNITPYSWRYVGGDDIFAKDRIAGQSGIIGPRAGIEVDGLAYWWGVNDFYVFNGIAQPLPCEIRQFLFEDINRAQTYKVYCDTNTKHDEIIWFYPSRNSIECDSYVTYDRKQQVWVPGKLDRTCWIDQNTASIVPLAVDAAGRIYQHEVGTTANGEPLPYYLETAALSVDGSGSLSANETVVRLRKIVPDYERLSGTHTLRIQSYIYPDGPSRTKGPYPFNAATRTFSPKARGAWMVLRWEGDGDFRMGDIKAHITADGGR